MKKKIKLDTIIQIQKLNKFANSCEADVIISSGRYNVDAKSIMGILSLSLDKEVDIELYDTNEKECERFVSSLNSLGVIVE